MTRLDDFESAFRSAVKTHFHFLSCEVHSVLVVADAEERDENTLLEQAKSSLSSVFPPETKWRVLSVSSDRLNGDLIDEIINSEADLIVTSRNVGGCDKTLRHTLGVVLDNITQLSRIPVVVMPPPTGDSARVVERVMVVTDHLIGDDLTVSWGVHFTPEQGTLVLCHVEDKVIFDHYAEALGQIQGVETATVLANLKQKLLSNPQSYIDSVIDLVRGSGCSTQIKGMVIMGHAIEEYSQLVRDNGADLLIVDSQDQTQTAMRGLAYGLAVEINSIPIILI